MCQWYSMLKSTMRTSWSLSHFICLFVHGGHTTWCEGRGQRTTRWRQFSGPCGCQGLTSGMAAVTFTHWAVFPAFICSLISKSDIYKEHIYGEQSLYHTSPKRSSPLLLSTTKEKRCCKLCLPSLALSQAGHTKAWACLFRYLLYLWDSDQSTPDVIMLQ